MNLLDNELVRKYFGCDLRGVQTLCDHFNQQNCDKSTSYRILQSLQEPIKKGERYLNFNGNMDLYEEAMTKELTCPSFHPMALRLPDRFQKQEKPSCVHHLMPPCGFCGAVPVYYEQPKPSPEKCVYNHGTGSKCDCKPKDEEALYSREVEEKIETMIKSYVPVFGYPSGFLRTELRSLLKLIRKGR